MVRGSRRADEISVLALGLFPRRGGGKPVDWRNFESYCVTVLAENGYRAQRNVWLKGSDRRQIDIVAARLGRVLCIDCKAWNRAGGASRTARAVAKQRERTRLLKGQCVERIHAFDPSLPFYPMIVTLKDEGLRIFYGTPIVSFIDFNSFLVHMEEYDDLLVPI